MLAQRVRLQPWPARVTSDRLGAFNAVCQLMSSHSIEETSKSLRLIAPSLLSVPLLGLIVISICEILAGVIRPLLSLVALTKVLWAGAMIASLISFGFLIAYSCIAFAVCGRYVWKLTRNHGAR